MARPPTGTVHPVADRGTPAAATTVSFRGVRRLGVDMTDEQGSIEPVPEVSTLPARTLREAELEALSAETADVELSPASIRVTDPPEVTSVFIEREGTLRVAGFSPEAGTWFVYGSWSDRGKSDRAVYELVDQWDARYYDELTAERM